MTSEACPVVTLTPIPEQGQLVDVRQRRYVVTEVEASTLPASPLKPAEPPQHLVTLTSVEDDGLGEELQVVWELEPGTRLHEKLALPDPTGFDPPARLDAFLDAVRWGAASTADIRSTQAPFRSGIEVQGAGHPAAPRVLADRGRSRADSLVVERAKEWLPGE